MVNLGDKVKDRITGQVGIAISRTEHINGCVRIGIQSPVGKDGKVPNPEYADIEQLEVMRLGSTGTKKTTGGYHRPPADLPVERLRK